MDAMNSTSAVLTETDTLSSEEYFQRSLVLERKRTERSGRPFLLIFLDIGTLLREKGRPRESLVDNLASALGSSTRETDVKGWYRSDSLIGIICPDVGKGDSAPVVTKLKNKLKVYFSQHEVTNIKMYVIHYPDYENQFSAKSPAHLIKELQPERKGMFFS
jgi:hypothetical protein